MSYTHENQMIKLDLINKHSYNQIKDKDLKYAHLWLVVIEVKWLHRKNLGAKALICLLWQSIY